MSSVLGYVYGPTEDAALDPPWTWNPTHGCWTAPLEQGVDQAFRVPPNTTEVRVERLLVYGTAPYDFGRGTRVQPPWWRRRPAWTYRWWWTR